MVGPARIEQVVLGDGAGRDDAGDFAADQALGLGRVLDLVADGDAMAGLRAVCWR